jgi:hypothetical protein
MAMADIHTLDIDGLRRDELLSRFLDGDLTAGEQADLEEKLANDAGLRARLESFKHQDDLIKASFRARSTTVSPILVARLQKDDKQPAPSHWQGRTAGIGLAASVVLAITVGLFGLQAGPGSENGFEMDSSLAQALSQTPSRAEGWDALDDDRNFRAVLTFPAASGNWCREFMVARSEDHWRGVACRHDGSWVTQVMAREVFLEESDGYRTASAADVDQVSRFIDAEATDVALSAGQEAAVIDANWR